MIPSHVRLDGALVNGIERIENIVGRAMQDESQPVDPAQLVRATPKEIADALAYALRYDERGKPSRSAAGWDFATGLAAEHLAAYLERCGFVVMRRASGRPHTA